MRLLFVLLLLAGCADRAPGEPGSAQMRVNGVYTTMGVGIIR